LCMIQEKQQYSIMPPHDDGVNSSSKRGEKPSGNYL
jgi:hypothetical protein